MERQYDMAALANGAVGIFLLGIAWTRFMENRWGAGVALMLAVAFAVAGLVIHRSTKP